MPHVRGLVWKFTQHCCSGCGRAGTERKVELLYMKAHRLANKYPGKTIVTHIYDDRLDIIEENHTFYQCHAHLLPTTMTFHLHLYSSEKRCRTGTVLYSGLTMLVQCWHSEQNMPSILKRDSLFRQPQKFERVLKDA